MRSINRKITSGILWNFASLFMTRGASTIFTLFLARLLAPEAFGLIAMVTIVFELANTFVSSGLGTALIRNKSVSDTDFNTVFYTNIVLSIIAYTTIFIGSPYVANFYNQPELILLIQVMGLSVFINATKIVQSAIFNRDMNFKALMKSNTLSVVLSGVLGVLAAWYGLGVWSLVIQSLSSACISGIMLWSMSNWKPSLKFSYESFTKLFKFSKNLLAEGILDVIFRNSYILVIGRLFSAEVTGIYFFATKLSNLISQQLTSAIQQATLPALATMQDETAALRVKYRQIIQMTMFVIAPVMALLAAVSPILVPLAFKEAWTPAVPYLQLLCIIGALYPLHAINVNLLMVKGRSDVLFKIGLLKRAFSITLLLLAVPYGVTGIIIAQIISSFFSLIPNTYFTAKLINYSLLAQSRDIIKPILSSITAGLFTWLLIINVTNIHPFIWLTLCGILGSLLYLGISILIRSEGSIMLINIYNNKLKKKVD
ncbi:lipopolysaccharide biosynthesis protein [Psychrobacter pacificensis]|uniref:lipopolysaccharide biosynthesis protein n=1 Tax=Psychrobacter pacificensis TaxID=112002 RepID=UPI003D045C8F